MERHCRVTAELPPKDMLPAPRNLQTGLGEGLLPAARLIPEITGLWSPRLAAALERLFVMLPERRKPADDGDRLPLQIACFGQSGPWVRVPHSNRGHRFPTPPRIEPPDPVSYLAHVNEFLAFDAFQYGHQLLFGHVSYLDDNVPIARALGRGQAAAGIDAPAPGGHRRRDLGKFADLLARKVNDLKFVRSWEAAPETAISSINLSMSKEKISKLADYKPDIVIGSQAD